MLSAQFSSLESRKLFAVDLTCSVGLNVPTPYYTDESAVAQIVVTVRNIGSTNGDLPISVTFHLILQ